MGKGPEGVQPQTALLPTSPSSSPSLPPRQTHAYYQDSPVGPGPLCAPCPELSLPPLHTHTSRAPGSWPESWALGWERPWGALVPGARASSPSCQPRRAAPGAHHLVCPGRLVTRQGPSWRGSLSPRPTPAPAHLQVSWAGCALAEGTHTGCAAPTRLPRRAVTVSFPSALKIALICHSVLVCVFRKAAIR